MCVFKVEVKFKNLIWFRFGAGQGRKSNELPKSDMKQP